MLARLQQALTLGTLAQALLWAWAFVRAGHPGWAVGGALLAVGGYALVLGVEFVLLRRAHGDDPAPRASAAQLGHAWWGEVRAAPTVFCWRQPFGSRRYPDALPAPDRTSRRGVLLVHGFVCNRGLWNRWLQRLREAGVPVIAVNLEPVFGSIDDYVPIVDAAVRTLAQHTGLAPVVVAHSMGGLALRRWWMDHGDNDTVHHAITLGTPHHGTWLARWAVTANGRQMRRGSRWLQDLASREPAARSARFTCFYSACDNIVFPPSTATLPGADNRPIAGVAHVHMVDRPEPWEELQRRLGLRPDEPTAPRC